ncbi:MAG: DUF2889 domain-containing protein [Hydrogenophaga sp.]|uniref:DUF2889 domain-containing protein n=1 Tax=Hydrogenophaga sp. TaxID=1904254 RepID=UPI003D131350
MSIAPPPAARRRLHLRRISCEGFLREDGLFEIEGLLIDTKPTRLRLVNKEVPPEEPIHQMRVRVTMDGERRIVDASAYSEHNPYPDCMEVEAGYRRLVGMRIEPGFTREVKRMFRGTQGCSHMTELLPLMASVAFQMLWADSDFTTVDPQGSAERSSPLGGCHALRLDGHIVKTYFPAQSKEPTP